MINLDTLPTILGKRIRTERESRKYTREKLNELSGLHTTYIGQVERGEKNISIITLSKIAVALDIPMDQLLENILPIEQNESNYPSVCYNLILEQPLARQKELLSIINSIIELDHLS